MIIMIIEISKSYLNIYCIGHKTANIENGKY